MTGLPGATRFPDGCRVRGRGLGHPAPEGIPDYGLYLGERKLRAQHDGSLTWAHDWLDWPDFRLPRNRDLAILRIHTLHKRALDGKLVEVACRGGKGRTGTVMACLAILAGVPAAEAVTWARSHYHPHAVETPWQRHWVTRFPAGERF